MADIALCLITSSEEGRGAYGIRSDTDQNVYFPVSIADALEIEEFDRIEAIMISNDRADPPWRAIKARRTD